MTDDPFAVLGLPPGATARDVHAARRRLAKEHHPDLGGDAGWMSAVNRAAELALAALTDQVVPRGPDRSSYAPRSGMSEPPGRSVVEDRRRGRRVVHDVASFTVEALPVEAFEALLVVTSWIGEVLDDDPPYVLEVHLVEPFDCWCRLELVPDAGASTVNLAVAGNGGVPPPDIDAVRDVWVDQLNRLDWDDLGTGPLPS